jgi:hypothetical protein
MTFRLLAEKLQDLEEEQLDCPAMAMIDEEYYPIKDVEWQDKAGALASDQPYLEVE